MNTERTTINRANKLLAKFIAIDERRVVLAVEEIGGGRE